VVVPQAVAYAQIAGLPPEAGLVAAPGAMLGYALLGTSRTLVVSATSATAAVSASTVGPLANGDAARFAALSAALALVGAGVFAAAGALRLGGVSDLISKPVLTGFLFGLGLTIAVGQLPKMLGIEGGSGDFFEKAWSILGDLGDTHWATAAVGAASVAFLFLVRRLAPALPASLLLLIGAIAVSSALGLSDDGVDVVGQLPRALPDPAVPNVSSGDLVDLLPGALAVALLGYAEAISVARGSATAGRYTIKPSRELFALGGANALAGLSQGFIQSGGASQTVAAERAGGRSQVACLVAAAGVLLTGAFLTGLFKELPQATLGAIVVVAVTGFFRVGELQRFARLRRSAIVISLTALLGVLALGVLPGLLVAAGLSLILVIQRLSRPSVGLLARDPATGAWARADRHSDWEAPEDVVVARVDGPLFYANAANVKEQLLAVAQARKDRVPALVLDLAESPDLDVETLDMLSELTDALAAEGIELRLASVRSQARELLARSGLAARVRMDRTIDAALT
jgi:high affinity sulfate transporter 1